MHNMNSKKVLVLYTSHSLGHKSIAENIAYYISGMGHTVKMLDALEEENSTSVSHFLKLHTLVYRYAPFIWRFMYLWGYKPIVPVLKFLARFHTKKIEAVLADFKPDIILSTQISPSGVISYLKRNGLYTGLFGVAFSDFHLHPSWLYPNVDFYLANIAEQKNKMITLGVPEQKIFVCGITTKPNMPADPLEIKRSLGIPSTAKVVLLSSGSLGIGMPLVLLEMLKNEVVTTMKEAGHELHIVIVCGKNIELYQELLGRSLGSNFHIVGFYERMYELYAISDLYISKAGGLTVSESLTYNLPLFVTHILPGQEELNLEYLSTASLIVPLCMKPLKKWPGLIIEELLSGAFKHSLECNSTRRQLITDANGKEIERAFTAMFHA